MSQRLLFLIFLVAALGSSCQIEFTPSVEPLVLATLPPQPFGTVAPQPETIHPTPIGEPPHSPLDPAFDPEDPALWILAIETRWEGVDVIACEGGEMVVGCQAWTAEELELLYGAMEDYPLLGYVDGDVVFVRDRRASYAGQARSRFDEEGDLYVEIHIADLAWRASSANGLLDFFDPLFPKDDYFQGTLAHELTHAAIAFHPELLDWWIEQKASAGLDWGLRNWRLGLLYSWGYYDDWRDFPEVYERLVEAELFSMAVASLMYDPWWGKGP